MATCQWQHKNITQSVLQTWQEASNKWQTEENKKCEINTEQMKAVSNNYAAGTCCWQKYKLNANEAINVLQPQWRSHVWTFVSSHCIRLCQEITSASNPWLNVANQLAWLKKLTCNDQQYTSCKDIIISLTVVIVFETHLLMVSIKFWGFYNKRIQIWA